MDQGPEPNSDGTTTLMTIPRTTLAPTLILTQYLWPQLGLMGLSTDDNPDFYPNYPDWKMLR